VACSLTLVGGRGDGVALGIVDALTPSAAVSVAEERERGGSAWFRGIGQVALLPLVVSQARKVMAVASVRVVASAEE